MTTTPTTPPAKGTRPRNRRELIRDAAAVLFAENGYGNVSLAEVANTVNIGRSALYRHYPGKAELLYDATDVGLDRVMADLPEAAEGLPAFLDTLVRNLLDNRQVGILWQREARNLPEAERKALRLKVRTMNQLLAGRLAAERPELTAGQADLLATCAVDGVASVSFHRLTLPRDAFAAVLVDLSLRVLLMQVPGGEPDETPSRPPVARTSRADELVDAATHLFAERGYAAVSIDDIGAAVGITGPSVYKHIESKHDLLLDAMVRGTDRLRRDLDEARAAGTDAVTTLRQMSDAYVARALEDSDLISTLIGETIHLHQSAAQHIRTAQRTFIDDWVAALLEWRPGEDPTVARVKVQAAQMIANDVGRTPHLHKVPHFRSLLVAACWEIQH